MNRAHTNVVAYTNANWAKCPGVWHSTSGYCVLIGENIVSKKHETRCCC